MIHSIPESALTQHIAVLGKTGSGKTTAVKSAVESILDAGGRVCAVDPTGAWWGLKSSANGKNPGYQVVIFGGSHADFPLAATHGEAIAEIIGTSSTPTIIDTSQMKIRERTRFFADFADAIMRKNKGPLHLVIDEAHVFMPQGKVPDPQAGEMLAAGNNLVSGGRSRGLRITLITQRPAKLHKDALTQVETLVAMRLIAPQDRKAVEEWIKDNADQAKGREIITSLATLKTGHGWVWAPEIDVLERITFPRIKTFDSSAAPADGAGGKVVLAPIDREAIAQRLEVVAADAIANDPKALKARIAELERDLRKPQPSGTHTAADIVEARQTGYRDGVEAAKEEFDKRIKAADTAIRDAISTTLFKHLSGTMLDVLVKPLPARETIQPRNPVSRNPPNARPRNGLLPIPAAFRAKPDLPKGEAATLAASQQKILNQLAWLEHRGIKPAPKETLAAVCDVSPTSGGYFNNLGKLRSTGLINYPCAGLVELTGAGRSAADSVDDDGRDVHEHWLDIVTEPQRKILEALVTAYPDQIAKDDLAGRIGVSSTSGGYFNNLGKLRTLGAIDYPSRGYVALTKYVMPREEHGK